MEQQHRIPALVFDSKWKPSTKWPPDGLQAPEVGYAYNGTGGMQLVRLTFPTGICGCFQIEDTGLDCFCAHCCCGPCIYDSAMRYAAIEGSGLAATATVFANNFPGSNEGGSDAAQSAANAAAAFARARVRQNLVQKFYPEGASEGFATSAFYHCCCASCAWCQEVNAVMVWSREAKGKRVYYGPAQSCGCAQLVDENNRFVYSTNPTTIPVLQGVIVSPKETKMDRV